MSKKLSVKVNGNAYEVVVGDLFHNPVPVTVNGKEYQVEIGESVSASAPVAAAMIPAATGPAAVPTAPAPAAVAENSNVLTAPMPGKILDIAVKVGTKVNPGQQICALEAMKMKNIIRTSRAGTIASVEVSEGQKVAFGAVIIRFA
jgi:biotin carboxyl carrier protein